MAVTIVNINDSKFSINGVEYQKHFLSVVTNDNVKILNSYDSKIVLQNNTNYSEYTVDGVGYGSAILLQSALVDVLFNREFIEFPQTTNNFKIIENSFDWASIPSGYDNATWLIRDEHDLGGSSINLPENVTLNFKGGKISNGTIIGDKSKIESNLDYIFNSDLYLSGNWFLNSVYPEWFGFSESETEINNGQYLQKAIDLGISEITYSDGNFNVSGVELKSFQTHKSNNGGCRLNVSSGNYIFTHSSVVQYCNIDGISFGGEGKAIYQPDTSIYSFVFKIKNCQFGNQLEESIYGTFILSNIEHNLFGANHGLQGIKNRHIYMAGNPTSGNTINTNKIYKNRFYKAEGSGVESAVFIQYGSGNIIQQNNFEECFITPLIIDSGGLTVLKDNWFENNESEYQAIFKATILTLDIYKNIVIKASGNNFLLLDPLNTHVFSLDEYSMNLSIDNNFFYSNSSAKITDTYNGENNGITSNFSNDFNVVNSEAPSKVTNGFANDGINGWGAAFGTLSVIIGGSPSGGNYFELTRTGNDYQFFTQVVAGLEVGKTYTMVYYDKSGTSGDEQALIEIKGAYNKNSFSNTVSNWTKRQFDFVSTDTFISLNLNKNTSTVGSMLFSDIKIYEKIK